MPVIRRKVILVNLLSPRPGGALRPVFLATAGLAAVALILTLPAMALPSLSLFGGQVYYAGGDVTIEVMHSDTKYTDVLRLWNGTTSFDLSELNATGSRVTLTSDQLARMGIGLGDELRFGIYVQQTNKDFVLGPGARNSDGLDHAYVRGLPSGVYVGWEDIVGGGDRDYNDSVIRLSGVRMTPTALSSATAPRTSVPEPAVTGLLLIGLGALGLAYRKR